MRLDWLDNWAGNDDQGPYIESKQVRDIRHGLQVFTGLCVIILTAWCIQYFA